jgi:hypothetical protein
MLRNPEAETYFASRSAHSDVGTELLAALTRLGEFEVRGNLHQYAAPYVVTAETVFCGAAGMRETFWRLRPGDCEIAVRCGAEPAPIGPQWVQITLFRTDWPRPDLAHWALRAYDFARTGG